MLSTRFERWITGFRVPWMGPNAKRIFGGFASVLGDRAVDWMTQAIFEHLPQYASAASLAILGADRQLEQGPDEPNADYAKRLIRAFQIWRFAGTPLGLLLAMHWAGFDGGVVVQQNGVSWQLVLPLPDMGDGEDWDPTPNLVKTDVAALPEVLTSWNQTPVRNIPAGQPWWIFDNRTLSTSRFAVIFPAPSTGHFDNYARAVFDGTTASVPFTWSAPLLDTSYHAIAGPSVITSGGPVVVTITGKTTVGATALASAPFVGYVDFLAWEDSAVAPGDITRLQRVIAKWRPAKATCVGIYLITEGVLWGWPLHRWGAGGLTWGPSNVAIFGAE